LAISGRKNKKEELPKITELVFVILILKEKLFLAPEGPLNKHYNRQKKGIDKEVQKRGQVKSGFLKRYIERGLANNADQNGYTNHRNIRTILT
jgi:hypothetical protein